MTNAQPTQKCNILFRSVNWLTQKKISKIWELKTYSFIQAIIQANVSLLATFGFFSTRMLIY